MFKIVEIRVKEEAMIDLGNRGNRLAGACDWARREGYFLSPPMSSTSIDYEMITHEARIVLGVASKDGVWCAVDKTRHYSLVETTAPADYDYGYVIPVADVEKTVCGKPGRLLAIPHKSVEYQTGRYMSGLHGARILDSHGGVFSEIETC